MAALPSISIIIPTLNSGRVLERCLSQIRDQDYPRELLEILVCDGNSTDLTREISRKYQVDQLLENPLKTGEAGKATGLKCAKNELIAFIDSDNFLVGKDWLQRMATPFQEDSTVVMTEPLYFEWDAASPPITRYCALMGLNDPFCYYTGNFDRWNLIVQNWTGFNIRTQDYGDWFWFDLSTNDLIPTIGANGTMYRRRILGELPSSEYFFDVDIPHQLVSIAPRRFVKVRASILHWYCPTFVGFLHKQRRRICDYLYHQKSRARTGHLKSYAGFGVVRFILSTLLILPCIGTSLIGYSRKRDFAWFLHWPLCFATLLIYGTAALQSLWQSKELDRSAWQKP